MNEPQREEIPFKTTTGMACLCCNYPACYRQAETDPKNPQYPSDWIQVKLPDKTFAYGRIAPFSDAGFCCQACKEEFFAEAEIDEGVKCSSDAD